jgi:hypothetical protein
LAQEIVIVWVVAVLFADYEPRILDFSALQTLPPAEAGLVN